MTATVFNIQKFSINDGPGIRTVVFLKGCPLNCGWCHNPESKQKVNEIFYDKKKCIGCKACETICKNGCHILEKGIHQFDKTNCILCGKCVEGCNTNALENVAREMSVSEVLKEVLGDKVFYKNSGGGITLSGGEPFAQFDFSLALLRAAKKENLHTCVETCGFTTKENLIKAAPFVDIFLFDYKLYDNALHKKYTGVDNKIIIENLSLLDSIGAKIILRCPIIPTINDNQEHFDAISKLANKLKNILEINIEPFHSLGSNKAQLLGEKYEFEGLKIPDEKTVANWIEKVQQKTDIPVKKA